MRFSVQDEGYGVFLQADMGEAAFQTFEIQGEFVSSFEVAELQRVFKHNSQIVALDIMKQADETSVILQARMNNGTSMIY
ncbi:hypothetical protein KIPB_016955, partial [Kipferlia bialata]|eukprot:g16955.t1